MNKLLKTKGPLALLENEIENLASMEDEQNFECLKQRCGLVKRALWELLDYLKLDYLKKDNPNTFKEGDPVIFEGKRYDFGYLSQVEGKAVIYEEGERNMQDSIAVPIKDLKLAMAGE